MKGLIIDKHISKNEEGQYIKFPVKIPEGIKKITVEYDYNRFDNIIDVDSMQKKEMNVIDFGLYSPEGFLGASGSNRNMIQISDRSDEGFSNTDILPGTWQIMIGAYKVAEEGVDVRYTIYMQEKELVLLKGDTHLHTNASDGHYSYEEVVGKAVDESLDYIILSDHNTHTQNTLITESEPITVIPGSEWTHYKGHANVIGLKMGVADPFIHNDTESLKALFNDIDIRGGFVSINHPFCNHCPWKWGMNDFKYQCVEIWNGGATPEANRKALDWWKNQLNVGRKLNVIGGSDFHKVEFARNLGQPVTCIWTYQTNEKGILNAIKNGNSYISYSTGGPSILIQSGESIQGDVAEDKNVNIKLSNLKARSIVHLIGENDTEKLEIEKDYEVYSITREVNNSKYIRVEIYNELSEYLNMPISLSNPLYFE